MFKHSERRQLPYTPQQLFDLVADVEKYPQFIDWFVSAHIRHRRGNVLVVDQVVRFAGLRAAFATRAVLDPPRQITISTGDFPFRCFDQHWSFTPAGDSGTLVQYDVALELRFRHLHRLMGLLIDQPRFAEATVNAFQHRADQIYGHGAHAFVPHS
jgi:coenzyme Q-binding protein COQ10